DRAGQHHLGALPLQPGDERVNERAVVVGAHGDAADRLGAHSSVPSAGAAGSISSISSGPLFRTLFTSVDTGRSTVRAGSAGTSSLPSWSRSSLSRSSQASQADAGRITGIRSWIVAITSFGAVVMIVQDRSGSWPLFGPRQTSHSPAKAYGSPSGRWMKY